MDGFLEFSTGSSRIPDPQRDEIAAAKRVERFRSQKAMRVGDQPHLNPAMHHR